MLGMMQVTKTCPTCHGKGKIINTPCSACSGQGVVRKNKRLTVTVPAGINDGQTFTLRGRARVPELRASRDPI
jgi:molecular chaperone DnaJ